MTKSFQAVLLSAGESSRFWPLNDQHKSLLKIGGRSLTYWAIRGLLDKGVKEVIVVIGEKFDEAEELKKEFPKIRFVIQKEPKGTGDAVFQAKELIDSPFIVCHGSRFDIGSMVPSLLKAREENSAQAVLLASPTDRPQDYGILELTSSKRVVRIHENPEPGKEPSNFKSDGIYLLDPIFFEYYKQVDPLKEDNLIDVFNLLIKEKTVVSVILEKPLCSLKYPWDALEAMRKRLEDLKGNISSDVNLGKNVVLTGEVVIETGVTILDNTSIVGPCFIGKNCQIGASNVIRGPVDLEEGVLTGAFSEIKNSLIGRDTHIHSGFFGDSVIGANCRFGAGFTSANRRLDRTSIVAVVKGRKMDTKTTYFGFACGGGTKFGINCSTMPGVLIGRNCVVGPSTVVKENLSDNTTLYSLSNEVKKENG